MKVCLIGVGMGNPDTLTIGAKRVIDQSEVLIGAKRMLEPFADAQCEKLALINSDDIAQAIAQRAGRCSLASVLLSGDVGFYSGATALYGKLGDYELEVIPGISSLVYFCAKLRTPWQDAKLVSAHGREHDAVGAIQSHEKTFCITGGATKVEHICAQLAERGLGDVRVAAGERLSYADERIVKGSASELSKLAFANLSVMLAFNPRPVMQPFGAPSLADADFLRGKAPMTKEEVRSLVIAKLQIKSHHVVWDVGAGTGSVSVEAARAACCGRVFAIEKNDAGIALIEKNIQALNAANVTAVAGSAPEALAGLPAPDRVFIGGSSGNLGAIVECAMHANPRVRICATAVTLETLAQLVDIVKSYEASDADVVQVAVSRADAVGPYHLMRAENPVYIVTFSQNAADVAHSPSPEQGGEALR